MHREQQQLEDHGKNSRVDLGVIGCGSHCIQSHLSKLTPATHVLIAGVYDPSKKSVDGLAEFAIMPAATFATEEELLLSAAQAVLIMSPDEFHAESLMRAVRAGKHVFVEKPLATTAEQLKVVSEALVEAEKRQLIVSSCHPRRFDPPFVWLKDNLSQLTTEMGPVSHFEFDFSYHKPVKEWKRQRGLLIDHINHEIDLVSWYFDHRSFTAWKLADSPDHYHAVGIREDGIHFSFNGSRQLDSREYREFVNVRFQRGTLTMDANLGEVRIHDHERDQVRGVQIPHIDYDTRFRLVNENFVQAVQGVATCYLTPEDLYVNTAVGVQLTGQGRWHYDREATGS